MKRHKSNNKFSMLRWSLRIVLASFLIMIGFYTLRYISKAEKRSANITVNASQTIGFIPPSWKAQAQGGEESGVQMLASVINDIKELKPYYIRIDHIFDYYNVIKRDDNGKLKLSWNELDKTVCDIYATGAKPFFVLGYMSPDISADGSLVSLPKSWSEWSLLVQQTIERYSGRSTALCDGKTFGDSLSGIYYEVWNEPDLETFGKWHYSGGKDYKTLYFYSSLGATRAQNTQKFFFGGPATTKAYKNWMQSLLRYITQENLRIDFLSWHHYSSNPDEIFSDAQQVTDWLAPDEFAQYRSLQKIISEWGYDSSPNNQVSFTDIGASHTAMTIRNLIDAHIDLAFAFEIRDGLNPSWGLLSRSGERRPRYQALKHLNSLDKMRLQVDGEGSFVRAVATRGTGGKVTLFLVNYDKDGTNLENVPIKFIGLTNSQYRIEINRLNGQKLVISSIQPLNGEFTTQIIMQPNNIVSIDLIVVK